MILAYDRIERIGQDKARVVREWEMRVHKAPEMPADIVPAAKAGYWQRIKRESGVVVIETWRLLDAARMVA